MSRKWTQYLVWKFFTTSQYIVDIFAEKCLKLKNAGILCRIFACLRLNLCARTRKKLAYGQMKNIISGADVCQGWKLEWFRQVKGHRFPDITECLWAVIDRGFWCACIRLSPIRLWRMCALPQTQPLYALSALTVVCVSLFRNTGARAPLFGEPPVALRIVSRMCLVSPGAYVTPYHTLRVCLSSA